MLAMAMKYLAFVKMAAFYMEQWYYKNTVLAFVAVSYHL